MSREEDEVVEDRGPKRIFTGEIYSGPQKWFLLGLMASSRIHTKDRRGKAVPGLDNCMSEGADKQNLLDKANQEFMLGSQCRQG